MEPCGTQHLTENVTELTLFNETNWTRLSWLYYKYENKSKTFFLINCLGSTVSKALD